MERAKGVEPLPGTWKAPILPIELNPQSHSTNTLRPGDTPFVSLQSFFRKLRSCTLSGIDIKPIDSVRNTISVPYYITGDYADNSGR